MYVTVIQPSSAVTADGNADNKTDLFVTNYGLNDADVLLNASDSIFIIQKTYEAGGRASSPASVDTNGGNKLDISVTNCNSKSKSVVPVVGASGNLSSSSYSAPDILK